MTVMRQTLKHRSNTMTVVYPEVNGSIYAEDLLADARIVAPFSVTVISSQRFLISRHSSSVRPVPILVTVANSSRSAS